jgi:FkbM family methyltransferase
VCALDDYCKESENFIDLIVLKSFSSRPFFQPFKRSILTYLNFLKHPLVKKHKYFFHLRLLCYLLLFRLLRVNIKLKKWINNISLNIQSDQSVLTLAYLYGIQDFNEFQFMRNFLKSGDIFVDVGGNVGTYATFAAGVLGCEVYTFEPNRESASILKNNVADNSLNESVHIYSVALGDIVGKVNFTTGFRAKNRVLYGDENYEKTEIVEVKTLDSLEIDAVRALKIDVEGSEISVLRGAIRTLQSESLLFLIIEMNMNLGDNHDVEIFEFLESFGFLPVRNVGFDNWVISNFGENLDWNTIFVRNDFASKKNDRLVELQLFSEIKL